MKKTFLILALAAASLVSCEKDSKDPKAGRNCGTVMAVLSKDTIFESDGSYFVDYGVIVKNQYTNNEKVFIFNYEPDCCFIWCHPDEDMWW